jgi:hypothetical protein
VRAIEKSLENELPNLLRDASRGVIIELSPGIPEPIEYHARREPCRKQIGERIMCYADFATNDDGTATAFCYCGWCQEHDTPEAAEAAAERHQTDSDAAEALFESLVAA